MSRGRPKKQVEIKHKRVEKFSEIYTKPELGWGSIWHFNLDKNINGPWKVEQKPPKNYKHPKPKIIKQQSYGKSPIIMVFKTSNRKNAKVKMKIWKNHNIDYIQTAKNLPGVPKKSEILELSVGSKFINIYKQKYNLS